MSDPAASDSAPAWLALARSWPGLALGIGLLWVGSVLTPWSGYRQCEWIFVDPTLSVPVGFPFLPETLEERDQARWLLTLSQLAGVPLALLGLTAFGAGIWSRLSDAPGRVLRLTRIPLAAALIASADRMLLLPAVHRGLASRGLFGPRDFFGVPWIQEVATRAGLLLAVAGLLLWPAAALLRSLKRRRGAL
jgi:hypothetical protein